MEESGANQLPPDVAILSIGNFSATDISANLILLKNKVKMLFLKRKVS